MSITPKNRRTSITANGQRSGPSDGTPADAFGGRNGTVPPGEDDALNGHRSEAPKAPAALGGERITAGNGGVINGGRARGNGATIERDALRALNGASPLTAPRHRERSAEQERRMTPPRRDAVFRRLLALADLIAATSALAIVAIITGRGLTKASLVSVPLIVVFAKIAGRYDHDEFVLRKSTIEEIPALLGLAAAYALAWSFVAFLAGMHLESHGARLVELWAATAGLLIAGRACARALAQISAPPERTLIIGTSQARAMLAHSLSCDPAARVEVVGLMSLEPDGNQDPEHATLGRQAASLDELETLVRDLRVDRVFLMATGADSETLLEAVTRTAAIGVKLSIVPRLFEVIGSAIEFDAVGGVTVLGVRRPGLGRSSRLIKRALDVAVSSVGLLVLAPLGLIIGLAIKLDAGGPIFFRQARVGRGGRRFQMIKFRSMIDGAEGQQAALSGQNESAGIFKLSADPRVTRTGRFLRRTSLDELPQLINVLRGEMSLVGPRPLVADEDVLIEGRYRARLRLSPGMTGPWQVLGPPRPPLAEMVKADYLYAANWSLWNDIKILIRTIGHVVAQRGV
jgi:exopolysaccharide biosynthesis polyprenyl glycosylphosphotransferase